jgi:hypothetical protein
MGVVYAEKGTDIRSELRTEILDSASRGSRQKPWNLVDSVSESRDFSEEDIRTALKKMMLEGDLEITSTGEVRATATPA